MKRRQIKTLTAILTILLLAAVVWQLVVAGNSEKPAPSHCETINQKQICGSDYIGLAESEAVAKAEAEGLVSRVVERDGQAQVITLDLRSDRLNFTITNGSVTKVDFL